MAGVSFILSMCSTENYLKKSPVESSPFYCSEIFRLQAKIATLTKYIHIKADFVRS